MVNDYKKEAKRILEKFAAESDRLAELQVAQVENVLKDQLASLGINIDFEEERVRRFKSLEIARHFHRDYLKESYYYNDGSVHGKLIITFITDTSLGIDVKKGNREILAFLNARITHTTDPKKAVGYVPSL